MVRRNPDNGEVQSRPIYQQSGENQERKQVAFFCRIRSTSKILWREKCVSWFVASPSGGIPIVHHHRETFRPIPFPV